ncbi:sulfate adenylyltransferase subunit CysN [Salinicola sp. MIT1003]|uniref:sulfate adenylyltransferase subunit CysN n=1 Tax=Salinicola sp. MIT1003 TaxID=1882734 RepID=UPI0008DDD644|nr:sulfate adenylyltransferase subunit CysN [Salinicola sp. MIT1003]MED5500859.1 sulfate adenylyltransferase subunit CysN [Pseudomonadota bacterium]OHZ01575.1 bifunctional sulfate adenylyltransferase subunit 1/adenylylsulfate kinase [Salinicola sp. MIT1003]
MTLQPALFANDIDRYLKEHESKGLLRFITCGSVDDGKSTLIGRLLHDSRMIREDQLAAVTRDSRLRGSVGGQVDLALLVDGLQAEREQGITIDVAYRFFSTDKRKFIIADTPGHEQYTRNMATGASTASLAVILIDARYGVQLQTRRHSFICDLLGIRHFMIAVNKMDLVDYSEARFQEIVADYRDFADGLNVTDVRFLPISALNGDNVVNPSSDMRWFDGAPLLTQLEQIEILAVQNLHELRFPVQYVNRPNLHFRGYCGTLAAGAVEVGTEIRVEPSGQRSSVARIVTNDGDLNVAYPGQSVTLTLHDEIDISRGDTLVAANSDIEPCTAFTADVVWLHETPLILGQEYEIKAGTRIVPGRVVRIVYQVDVNTMARSATDTLGLNGIARCQIEVTQPLVLDSYQRSPETGNFIFIDKLSNLTVGAGMVVDALNVGHIVWHDMAVTKRRRAERNRQKPSIIWFTGLSGAGKSTVADALERQLFGMGYNTYLLDGDNVRHGLCRDLGFSDEDRQENIRRIGEVARLMVDAGMVTLVSFISPFRDDRRMIRNLVEDGEFIEVFVNTPLAVCEQRDPKGLYRKARRGEISQFTGISSPYEAPESPEVEIDTSAYDLEETVGRLIAALRRHRII